MLLLCIVGFFIFSVALGFWMGWYVRGAYIKKKDKKDESESRTRTTEKEI